MERNEELVDVSMELFDNVVLNRRILPVNMLSTDNLVRNAVRRYDDAPYIPDNTFVVLRCPLDGKIPGSDYFDTEEFRANHGELPDTSVSFFGSLQLAAYCLREGLPATSDNMKALERSPGYAAFRDMQADKLWQYQEKLLSERPYEERLDDWSFVFVTTDRKFTEAERQDILTLGLLMSTGIESELYTPSRVPSYHLLKPHFDRLNFMRYGNVSSSAYKIFKQCEKFKAAAGKILADKYPEVAPTIHERCGLPSGTPGNEAYALVGASGDVVDFSINQSPLSSFYSYIFWHIYSPATHIPATGDYSFYRYRLDDRSLLPPKGLTEQQMWERLHKAAVSRGIEPLDRIPLVDARYCMDNGRNSLHPDNCHQNLLNESLYQKTCGLFPSARTGKKAEQEEEMIHIETDAFDTSGKRLKM